MPGALPRLEASDRLPDAAPHLPLLPEATAGGLDQRLKGGLTA
jgi:hypothetical protein